MDDNNNVRSFTRPAKQQSSERPAQQMVRVVDITSPFFNWEGWVCNVFTNGEEDKQYVQIVCAHSGFQFPPLTFATDQIVVRK